MCGTRHFSRGGWGFVAVLQSRQAKRGEASLGQRCYNQALPRLSTLPCMDEADEH